jgi:hypothetical protein
VNVSMVVAVFHGVGGTSRDNGRSRDLRLQRFIEAHLGLESGDVCRTHPLQIAHSVSFSSSGDGVELACASRCASTAHGVCACKVMSWQHS